jgi:hypothetical protein
MLQKTTTKKRTPQKSQQTHHITVPTQSGFNFYTALGQYTGVTASNLAEFAEKLQTIASEAIIFHFQRDDFQKWLRCTLFEDELARRIDELKLRLLLPSGEELRKELVDAVQKRLAN